MGANFGQSNYVLYDRLGIIATSDPMVAEMMDRRPCGFSTMAFSFRHVRPTTVGTCDNGLGIGTKLVREMIREWRERQRHGLSPPRRMAAAFDLWKTMTSCDWNSLLLCSWRLLCHSFPMSRQRESAQLMDNLRTSATIPPVHAAQRDETSAQLPSGDPCHFPVLCCSCTHYDSLMHVSRPERKGRA
jgi:hypothetical protein